MKRILRTLDCVALWIILTIPILVTFSPSLSSQPTYLWKASLVQAAPGKLLELIDLYKAQFTADSASGEPKPFWMRHAQGDKWDLMLLYPLQSYSSYFRPERINRLEATADASKQLRDKITAAISWQEDIFVYGPTLDEFRKAVEGSNFFHVEMFVGLAGKGSELHKEREMENAYQRALKRPENLIFVRDQGAAWTLFTLGAYRDLRHYAASADISEKEQEAAARAAGFESARYIGPFLRTLIREHHDTLLSLVR